MSRKWFSPSKTPYYPSIISNATRVIVNTSDYTNMPGTKTTARRWLNGMIMGSIPFLIILFCWMFVSLCVNNLVRIYHRRKHRLRSDRQENRFDDQTSKMNV